MSNPKPFDKIEIEFIDHKKQRYDTCGDWRFVKGVGDEKILLISVSKLSDWRREILIAIHEAVEVCLCAYDGVSQEVVDKFDTEYEAHRHPDNEDEPGDDPSAPYMRQHCIATGIERTLAAWLNVSWKEYEEELGTLEWK